jgi:hypothetical protein
VHAVCVACGRGGTSGQGKIDRHNPPCPQPHGAVRRPRCRDDLISLPYASGPMLASLPRRLLRRSRTSGGFRGLGYARGGNPAVYCFFFTLVARTLRFKRKESKQGAATLLPKQTVCRLVTYCSMVRSVCAEQDQRSECVCVWLWCRLV